ncbi:hypothetical protein AYO47_00450 [Planctomyces sp. SCGC AG-212-M04]|nr:hypothetical protein AYO47_00450 [Planctomyces sp. SCGC AG-212-M04]
MNKFRFGLLAAALMVSPAFADDAAPAPKPEVCPAPDANAVVCTEAHCTHECRHEVMMTMVAVPDGGPATDPGADPGTADPTLMYMTGVVDDSAGPVRHQEGENLRDFHVQNTGGINTLAGGGGSNARFEGLTQVAAERRGFGSERSAASASDRSSLKAMLFGNKVDAKTKTTLVANDRARMQKMAEVDQLRDKALKTGDAKLLAKADAMEKEVKVDVKAKSKFSLFGRK